MIQMRVAAVIWRQFEILIQVEQA